MRFIPTRIHGILDYVIGVALIAAPWIFGFSDQRAAMWVPIILGAGLILYSLLTDYELGVIKAIPMPVHLALDGISGLFLAASPWLFGFADESSNVWVPHVVVGVFEILAALTTQTRPAYEMVEGGRRMGV
ncbi:MAG: SPW repeat protein [Sphaerobacter thermophilus]|uniref:SPW repeat protein n=1 Tax=Sphaerobacter thermophilus TaxID=2057 RepID=UPI000DB06964|nr:MAG: hypothetical protein DIU58_10670 [Sphaerobacter thermophilus]